MAIYSCPSSFKYFVVNCLSIKFNFQKTENRYEIDTHLNFEHIRKICYNSVTICKSNDSNICAMRLYNNETDYKDFENSCFLFINNMCQDYGKEFSIVSAGLCSDYLKIRRNFDMNNKTVATNSHNSTSTISSTSKNVTTKPVMRAETTFSTVYEIDTAFDYHICPFSCPNVYSPVCIGVNRGHGMYYKFFTFVNHCAGDLYYCKNWREFSPPPDEDEMVKSSPLSWSYCAANRYIQFARFTEMTSSMGHYGWLAGDFKPTHIVEPHERMPGYG
ncbi:uncharacterized protein LOC123666071 [Melitaea cinxia]|uniref:uncharacterized protein LOC123666071 n=1 Tax=Melitaea cinxia TaxID=113334 RepID=UPI001E27027B|nr:uncharacterized protein LOC123666071 [Melitaea cinxia]